ncbi:MAG: cation:dicarboxylase symporter family transporter, partial [Sphaerochaetaceae bacterium]
MKTWITYPAAIILGFAANTLLGGWAPYEKLLLLSVPLLKEIALFILLPVVFVLFAGATASSRRHKETTLVFSLTIVWGLFTTLILSFAAMGATLILPFRALAGNTLQAGPPVVNQFFDFSNLKSFFLSDNAFGQFTVTSTSLVPVMILALLFGIAMRPDKEEIRPAYVVLNSFSEAMLRLARIFTTLGALFLLFISAAWFKSFDLEVLLANAFWYVISLGALMVGSVVIILPLIYRIFTLFRGGSALRVGFGAFPAMFASAITGNLFYGTTSMMALSNQNNGVRKRVTGISIPLFTIIGRG